MSQQQDRYPTLRAPGGQPYAFDQIPLELRERPQWVCWRIEYRPDRYGRPKATKVPQNPREVILGPVGAGCMRQAKPNNPNTWADYQTALASYTRAVSENNGNPEACAGIGYVFSAADPYTGIDTDDAATTALILERFPQAYIETSVSQRGIHAIVRGRSAVGLRQGKLEVYSSGRFFVFTGWKQPSRMNGVIPEATEALQLLVAEYGSRSAQKRYHPGEFQRFSPTDPRTLLGFACGPTQLKHLEEALEVIPSDDRDLWIRIGHALATVPNEAGFELWEAWSRKSDNYVDGDERQWFTFRPERTHWRAVFAEAMALGWVNPLSNDALAQQAAEEAQETAQIDPQALRRALAVAEPLPTAQSVLEALRLPEREVLVIAPGGTGKTHALAQHAVDLVQAGVWVLVVLTDKDAINEFDRMLIKISGHGCADLGLVEMHGDRDQTTLPPIWDCGGVVTHGGYLRRKGQSRHWHGIVRQMASLYALDPAQLSPEMMRWRDMPREVLVDEADAFLTGCVQVVTLDHRSRARSVKGRKNLPRQMIPRCPASLPSGGEWSCNGCRLERDSAVREVSPFQHAVIEPPRIAGRPPDGYRLHSEQVLAHCRVELEAVSRVFSWSRVTYLGRVELSYLRELFAPGKDAEGNEREPGAFEEEEHDYEAALIEMIATAFRPRLVQSMPTINHVQYDPGERSRAFSVLKSVEAMPAPMDPTTLLAFGPGQFKTLAEIQQLAASVPKEAFRFPHYACGVRHLMLADTMPLWWLQNFFPKVRFCTATWDNWCEDFTRSQMPRMVEYRVESQERMIDELLIIDAEFRLRRADIERLADCEGFRSLVFHARASDALKHYTDCKNTKVGFFLKGYSHEREMRKGIADGERSEQSAQVVTYARSTAGRGKNLGCYSVCVVDQGAYGPTQFHSYPEVIEDPQETVRQARDHVIEQNGYRIMRPYGDGLQRRVLIVHNPDMEFGPGGILVPQPPSGQVIAGWSKRALRVERAEVAASADRLVQLVETFMRTGQVDAGLEGTSRRSVGLTKRLFLSKVQFAERLAEMLRKLETLREEDVSWRDATRRVSSRLFQGLDKAFKSRLREAYKGKEPLMPLLETATNMGNGESTML